VSLQDCLATQTQMSIGSLQESTVAEAWPRCHARRVWRFGSVCGVLGGMCGVSMDKRHTLKALQHKGLRRVWRLWRLFSTLEGLEEEVRLIVRSPVLGSLVSVIVRSTQSRRKNGQSSCQRSGGVDRADQTPHMPHMPQSLMV